MGAASRRSSKRGTAPTILRHTADDDLLGTALILTATVCLLSIMALATKSTADKRHGGA